MIAIAERLQRLTLLGVSSFVFYFLSSSMMSRSGLRLLISLTDNSIGQEGAFAIANRLRNLKVLYINS